MKQVDVLVDPYQVYKDRLKNKLEKEANAEAIKLEQNKKEAKKNSMGWFGPNVTKQQGSMLSSSSSSGGGVGKYLQKNTSSSTKRDLSALDHDDIPSSTSSTTKIDNTNKKLKSSQSYGNFDNF